VNKEYVNHVDEDMKLRMLKWPEELENWEKKCQL